MQFTLAFLAVGLIVALVLLSAPGVLWRDRVFAIVAVGAGFLVVTLGVWAVSGANPFVIWWWNQRHHARFYEEFSRSYRAWVVANPITLAVGLGIPATLWACAGVFRPRETPRVSVATAAVLALL